MGPDFLPVAANDLVAARVQLTSHAMMRARQRIAWMSRVDASTLSNVMMAAVRGSQLYGECCKVGDEFRRGRLGGIPVVFLLRYDDIPVGFDAVVITTLTVEESHNAGTFRHTTETRPT